MKKISLIIFALYLLIQPAYSMAWQHMTPDEKAVKKVLKSQVKYANTTNFEKFISTFDNKYINADGFNLDEYSSLVKDIWSTYDNIEYGLNINKLTVTDNKATVEVTETSFAKIPALHAYDGELNSVSNSVYYLEKIDGKWKVVSDKVLDENTLMLYGEAKDLDIKLSAPNSITANTDYTATLEFTPPKERIAIASIASDIVEYPQKPTQEVFRALPEDNILERIFTSNNDNANEYVVASIGLTQTDVTDLNIKLSLTGFGYAIKRVNVVHNTPGSMREGANDKDR